MTVKDLLSSDITIYATTQAYKGQRKQLRDFLWICSSTAFSGHQKVLHARSLHNNQEQYRAYKSTHVPCATISCQTGKTKADIRQRNNVMCIDIDHIDPEQIATTKDKLMKHDYIFCSMVSLSGCGIVALAHVEFNDDIRFRQHYQFIASDLIKEGIEVDLACSNVNRLRYMTYDDDIRIKGEDEEIPACSGLLTSTPIDKQPIQPANQANITDTTQSHNDLVDDDDFVEFAIRYLVNKDGYKVNGYKEWFTTGCRLSSLPYELGLNLYQLISENSPSYVSYAEVRAQFDKCTKWAKITNRECLSYYFRLLKDKHGPNWVTLVKGYQFLS